MPLTLWGLAQPPTFRLFVLLPLLDAVLQAVGTTTENKLPKRGTEGRVRAMTVELWWWIPRMALTGLLTVGVGVTIAYIVHGCNPFSKLPGVLIVLSLIPWSLAVGGAIVWAISNILILIWR